MPYKQVIVVRKDLNMRKGKIAAQVAHASMKAIFDGALFLPPNQEFGEKNPTMSIELTDDIRIWVIGNFRKICVYVNSEEELLEIQKAADLKGIRTALIIDAGLTEFNGVPTKTCVAIGPNTDEKIDEITEHLPLL